MSPEERSGEPPRNKPKPLGLITAKVESFLLSHYMPEPNTGCWLWVGSCDQNGYGSLPWNGRSVRAHRAMWTYFRGPIPDGLVIDHMCRVRCCVNPDHLRAVTVAINSTENSSSPAALHKSKTHCYRGHPLFGPNRRAYTPQTDPQPRRVCRACERIHEDGRVKRVRPDRNRARDARKKLEREGRAHD